MPSAQRGEPIASGRAPLSASTVRCSRSTYSASLPASSTRLLLTSSSGSVEPIHACESSDSATPASTRSMPKRQVLWTKSTPNGLRCSWSNPQRMFACAHPAGDALEVVVGEPEPRAAPARPARG